MINSLITADLHCRARAQEETLRQVKKTSMQKTLDNEKFF